MHNIKWIRENAKAFDEAMRLRVLEPHAEEIINLDREKRENITQIQELQKERNAIAKEIGMAKRNGEEPTELFKKAKEINDSIEKLEAKDYNELTDLITSLPNILSDEVPAGNSEDDNIEIRKWGDIPEYDFTPKEHWELGENLGLMDFETATKMSGSRFVLLKGQLARLERALINFMLDIHTKEFGYTEVNPPFMVKDNALFGTGQLPKFKDDLFKTTSHDLWLIPTAEVPLTNIVAGDILDTETLPIRYTAYTPCFRSEAGSAGKDTRGMIRQHQFNKVELVSITTESQAKQEFERMLSVAEEVLKQLKLPYRLMLLCSGDTGFSACKTYDLEVWMAGQNKYREISSCSHFAGFHARRMNTRHRAKGEKETHFIHTLNGSALAVGRTLIAVLENYQNKDGSFELPEVLKKYM